MSLRISLLLSTLVIASTTFAHDITLKKSDPKVSATTYGDNLVGLFPLVLNNSGVGLGLSYERLLGKKSRISIYVPVTIGFAPENPYLSGSANNIPRWGNQTSFSYYTMPGVKIYPTGAKGKVRYAVGPALALRYGNKKIVYSTYPLNSEPIRHEATQKLFTAGAVVNNSLNINPTKHFFLGVELALGLVFYEEYEGVLYGDYDPYEPTAQFGFKLGYRF